MTGVYIHIPFCIRKCNYCDFVSYPCLINRADEYIDSLIKEIKSYPREMVDTIYFGGGTPSVMSVSQLGRIIEAMYLSFDVMPDAEVTIEVNPGTVDFKKLSDIKKLGFNRMSIGSQTFLDSELETLGRIHTSSDTIRCYTMARDAGFDNISLDLMYAIPGQNMEDLSTSIGQVLKMQPEHISCYGLKFESGTPFYDMLERGELSEKSDDEYADMYELIAYELQKSGYMQYELSNFSRPLYESKHNLKYWLTNDYIGLGIGASSCFKGKRYTNTSDFGQYVADCEKDEILHLSAEDKMSEFMILSLRLTELGANKDEFKRRFGSSMENVFSHQLKKHLDTGMLCDKGDRIVLSPKAYYVSNSVLCDFL